MSIKELPHLASKNNILCPLRCRTFFIKFSPFNLLTRQRIVIFSVFEATASFVTLHLAGQVGNLVTLVFGHGFKWTILHFVLKLSSVKIVTM